MSEKKKPRVGFVGVGNMGQNAHLKNYAALDDCEVVAISELRPELGKKVGERYHIPSVYTDHKEMLAKEDLDALVASQAFGRHGAILPELLMTGKPVFSEKPLAHGIEIGEKIVEAEKDGGSFLMLGYHKRSDPATMWAKEQIEALKDSKELGELKYVRILMPAGDWIAAGFDDLIRSQEAMAGISEIDPPPSDMDEGQFKSYTEFVNYYIHQINLMRYLLGEEYRVAYVAPAGAMLAVESASGISGVIEMSPYTTTIDWQEQALVCFERGYVKIDLPAPLAFNRPGQAELMRDPNKETVPQTIRPTLPWTHAMRQQAINFISAVHGETGPLCTAEEALLDLKNAREWLELAVIA